MQSGPKGKQVITLSLSKAIKIMQEYKLKFLILRRNEINVTTNEIVYTDFESWKVALYLNKWNC